MSRKKILISELNLNKIGGRIAYIRLKNNLSQSKFAENVGISIGNLSGLENHKYEPSYRAIIKILEVFKVDPIWLLIGEGEMTRQGTEGDASIYKVGDPLDEDPEIAELLSSAKKVLDSGTDRAETLAVNIRSSCQWVIKDRPTWSRWRTPQKKYVK